MHYVEETDYIQSRLFKNSSSLTERRTGVIYYDCTNFYFEIEPGSMIPLEKKILDDFSMSRFVICTDSGLSSGMNRCFNTYDKEDGNRSFVTTQSIKKLKSHLKKWALEPTGWYLSGNSSMTEYDIRELDDNDDKEKIFFKSRWVKEKAEIHEDGKTKTVEIEQQLIVSYSIKYRDYLRSIRNGQIERAARLFSVKCKRGCPGKSQLLQPFTLTSLSL